MRISNPILACVPLIGLTACGSPLLDHKTSPKPKVKSLAPSVSPTSKSQRSLKRIDCVYRIEKTPLCASLEFSERPSYQASLKSFQADFKIWDERDPQKTLPLRATPMAFHRCETECCPPPQIEVKLQGNGEFKLSNIEFHAVGWFDFLIEVHSAEFGVLRVQIPVEVFDE